MSLIRKRKLTQNQSRRIDQNNELLNDSTLASGIIVSHFGKQLDVKITQTGNQYVTIGQIYRCYSRTNLPMLAVNDGVKLSFDAVAELGRIEKLLPRQSLITRPDRYHKVKPVGANVDLLVIVFAPLPAPSAALIDRYLLIGHITQTPCLLLLNKADLLDTQTDKTAHHTSNPSAAQLLADYAKLGIATLASSFTTGIGLTQLASVLQGKTSIFAGQSGVGKSSLINLLIDHAAQATNIISDNSKLGQHTTTASRLLFFAAQNPDDGGIIDTPGIREYGIWHLSKNDILGGFIELNPLANACKFRNCAHTQNSVGCALWAAAARGEVLPRRIDSLLTLQTEAV